MEVWDVGFSGLDFGLQHLGLGFGVYLRGLSIVIKMIITVNSSNNNRNRNNNSSSNNSSNNNSNNNNKDLGRVGTCPLPCGPSSKTLRLKDDHRPNTPGLGFRV